MPSSATDRRDATWMAVEALTGEPVRELVPVRRSGNSRVFRATTKTGTFALKLYPPRGKDPRDRLGVEAAALDFMRARGIGQTPRPITADRGRNAALLEWIEGDPVAAPAEADIDAALAFLDRLHKAACEDAKGLPLASEACLSAAELERQIARRLIRLAEAGRKAPQLAAFLDKEMTVAADTLTAMAKARYAGIGLAWEADLEEGRRTLSPSDFGFHNALRRPDGTLAFLDFEYFGWDDPAKLACDVLLHPGMDLPAGLKLRFLDGVRTLFGGDLTLAVRLDALYPLFGLRWCAILLNEFLPEKWALRVHAGESDAAAAQARQLTKARALLQRLTDDDPIRQALKS